MLEQENPTQKEWGLAIAYAVFWMGSIFFG